jgi:hypothetical protein
LRKANAASKVIANLMLLNGYSGSAEMTLVCSRRHQLFSGCKPPAGIAAVEPIPVPEFLHAEKAKVVASPRTVAPSFRTDLVMTNSLES